MGLLASGMSDHFGVIEETLGHDLRGSEFAFSDENIDV